MKEAARGDCERAHGRLAASVETVIELRPLTEADVEAHNRGEDEETIRWLSESRSTTRATADHFSLLADNARQRSGKRGFGVWLDGVLAGYVDCDPTVAELPEVGDVNIAYGVHPWARRRGVAVEAVGKICAFIVSEQIGTRAIIRVDPANTASVGVARAAGFTLEERRATEEPMQVYFREL